MTSHAPVPVPAQEILEFPLPATTLPFSGERFTPAAEGMVQHEHFHRYLSIRHLCAGKRVADIACGEGYGSWLLSDVAREVHGIDVDAQTIAHCQATYVRPNLHFQVGNAVAIPLPDASLDVLVSFETLEHMVEHEAFLAEIRRVLSPQGLLIISTPDRDVYSADMAEPNHFHLRELTRAEFGKFLAGQFRHVRLFGQRSTSGSVIGALDNAGPAQAPVFFDRVEDRRFAQSGQMPRPVYLIALASDAALPATEASVLLDDGFVPDLHRRYHAELERVWAEANTRLERIQAQDESLAGASGRIATLEQTVQQREQALESREKTLQALDHTLQSLELALQSNMQTLQSYERTLASQAVMIVSLHQERGQALAQVDQLRRDHAAVLSAQQQRVEAAQAQIDALVASTSWRLTRPLRWIKRRFDAGKGAALRRIPVVGGVVHLAQLRRSYGAVRDSGLFDAEEYLRHNPDVRAAGVDPLWHYLRRGAAEGRAAGPGFDAAYYVSRYPDVAGSELPAIVHYVRHGRAENRAPIAPVVPGVPVRAAPAAAYMTLAPGQSALLDEAHSASALAAMPGAAQMLEGVRSGQGEPAAGREEAPLSYQPLISILLPTYNTEDRYLRQAVQSVLNQSYANWELCIVDDGSRSESLHACLDVLAGWDKRIRIQRNERNQGISGATNDALGMARGEFVAMLDHDDELLGDALHEIVVALNRDPQLDALYTDQDYIEADGSQAELLVKPDWSPTLMCGVMFVGHLLVVRRALASRIGGFDGRFNNVQDFEFMLRVAEASSRIHHIDKVLYHWRRIPGSVALNGNAKSNIEQLQSAAVTAHLERRGLPLRAVPHAVHAHRATLEPTRGWPELTVPALIVGAHLQATPSPGMPPQWPQQLRPLALSAAAGESRVARLDQAIRDSDAPFLLVSSADLPGSEGWLDCLIAHLQDPQVALAEALLVDGQDIVVEAGLIVTAGRAPIAALRGRNAAGDGYAGSLACAREVSAVSGACLLLRRDHYLELGGLNRQFATLRHAWADYSLRASRAGLRNIVVPTVKAVAAPGADPASAHEQGFDALLFEELWRGRLPQHDPYHNRHLALHDGGYQTSPGTRAAEAIAA